MVKKLSFIGFLFIVSCKSGFFLPEGGYRPVTNKFKVNKLKKIDNNLIDVNSIYVGKWTSKLDNDTIVGVFRFYKNNKVSSYTYMNNNYTTDNYLNPKSGYMGYYEFIKDNLHVYFFVRKDVDGFFKSKLRMTSNKNISRDGQIFFKQKIKNKLHQNYEPDW